MSTQVHAPSDPLAALPVALELSGAHAEEVRRFVEGALGWQPVDDGPADPVPAAVCLIDPHGPSDVASVPTVLLLPEGISAQQAADAGRRVNPDAVVAWPADRDVLATAVAEVLARPSSADDAPRLLQVGGAAGGVGTSTVALALGAMSAWARCRTLVAVRDGASVRAADVRLVDGAALAASDLGARAQALPGVPEARCVRVPPGGVAVPTDPRLDVVVLDGGVSPDVEVLVVRGDAAGLAALEVTTAAAVVVTGEGPAPRSALIEAAGGRRLVQVPSSTRVARAGLRGRLPSGLPGAWLRRLTPLAPRPSGPQ